MKYGAERARKSEREREKRKKDKNMEDRSRVRRHEITKNGIDVEMRDPYRYQSVPLSFGCYIVKSARKTVFSKNVERKKDNELLYALEIALLRMLNKKSQY